MRALRASIDELADLLAEPYAHLEAQQAEARALIGEINDMELELAQTRALTGSGAGAGSRWDVHSTLPPRVGTLTLEEAEQLNEEQLEQMQLLEEATSGAARLAKEKQRELASALRAVERLSLERKREEKYAEEVGKDGGRDFEVEQLCEK